MDIKGGLSALLEFCLICVAFWEEGGNKTDWLIRPRCLFPWTQVWACSHIKPICFTTFVLCRSANSRAPSPPAVSELPHPLLSHSSFSSPERAVTLGKLYPSSQGCSWSSAAVTRESSDRLSFCLQRHSTPITVCLTPQLWYNLVFSVWFQSAGADERREGPS